MHCPKGVFVEDLKHRRRTVVEDERQAAVNDEAGVEHPRLDLDPLGKTSWLAVKVGPWRKRRNMAMKTATAAAEAAQGMTT